MPLYIPVLVALGVGTGLAWLYQEVFGEEEKGPLPRPLGGPFPEVSGADTHFPGCIFGDPTDDMEASSERRMRTFLKQLHQGETIQLLGHR